MSYVTKRIEITPKMFGKGCGYLCSLHPLFVSNGYWAVKRTAIENAAMFANEETARTFTGLDVRTVGETASIWPTGELTQVLPTALQIKGCVTVQTLYRGALGWAAFDAAYLKALGAGDKPLWHKIVDGPVIDAPTWEKATFILMPTSIEKETFVLLAGA